MYLTIKQQLKHLTKDNYLNLKELCHIAKNLTNKCIHNVEDFHEKGGRGASFKTEGEWEIEEFEKQFDINPFLLVNIVLKF